MEKDIGLLPVNGYVGRTSFGERVRRCGNILIVFVLRIWLGWIRLYGLPTT